MTRSQHDPGARRLEIVTADTRVTAYPGSDVRVGRDPQSTVRIDDPLVSRQHLRVYADDDRWIAEDTGSSNGSFVGGASCDRVVIDAETTIMLGDPTHGPWLRLIPADAATADHDAAGATGDTNPAGPVTIGRGTDNQIVLDDPLVSRRHAELRTHADGRSQLVDVGSFNGTFVNGDRVDRAFLAASDLVVIGGSQFRFTGSRLEVLTRRDQVGLAAVGISVSSRAGAALVDDVSFTLDQGSLLAIVGPSGAGKSTLLGALTGVKPARRGSVYFAGRDLYAEYDALRQQIGFVPQDDVVHRELTVAKSLDYAAELRFAPDVAKQERRARVAEVIDDLGLGDRRSLPVAKLSGGQRKRVSVALELLTKPALLFLDEPASGLDPGLERSLMRLLRSLADGGRTVVVVTHSTESLSLCDRVLFLAPGGSTAFFGPPQLALEYFGRPDYQEVFTALSSGDPEAFKTRFRSHPLSRQYLAEPADSAPGERASLQATPGQNQRWLRQLSMLTRRYARVLAGDRANVAMLLGAAPLLGLLQLWVLPSGELATLPTGAVRVVSQASLVLLVLAIAMTLTGLSNSLREVVKELPVFRRERAVGLSTSAYVASKTLVLAAVSIYQAFVYVTLATINQGGPSHAVLLGWPLGEMIVASALTGIAAIALGLLVSSVVSSVNAAIALLPVLLIGQLMVMPSGVFGNKNKPVLHQLGYVSSAGWGFAASASTVKLNDLQTISNIARSLPTIDLRRPQTLFDAIRHHDRGNPAWNHQPGAWLRAVAALGVIILTCLALATTVLRRFDPL